MTKKATKVGNHFCTLNPETPLRIERFQVGTSSAIKSVASGVPDSIKDSCHARDAAWTSDQES